MRIAVLSDVHGNLGALLETVEESGARPATQREVLHRLGPYRDSA